MKLNASSMLLPNAIIFSLILVMWPILMVLSQLEGSIHQQLEAVKDAPALYVLNFVLASLIAPALTMLLATLTYGVKTRVKTPTLNKLSCVSLICYVALVSVGYVSQYTLLQLLLSRGSPAAEYWFFNNPDSAAYFLNQLGYVFFALGAMLTGYKFLFEQGLPRIIGGLLWLSATLSIVAFVGLILKDTALNFSTIISGGLTLPIGILSVVWGAKLRREIRRLQYATK